MNVKTVRVCKNACQDIFCIENQGHNTLTQLKLQDSHIKLNSDFCS